MDPVNLFGMIFGGISALLACGDYYHNRRKVSRLHELSETLKAGHVFDPKKPIDEHVLTLLEFGSSVGCLVQRVLLKRLLLVGLFLGLSTAALATDSTSRLSPALRGLDGLDITLGAVQLLVALFGSSAFMTDQEGKFLRNLSALNDYFYEEHVVPAMGRFNAAIDDMSSNNKHFGSRMARIMAQDKRLQQVVQQELEKKIGSLRLEALGPQNPAPADGRPASPSAAEVH